MVEGICLLLLGVFILLATIFRWNWVRSHFKVAYTYKELGEVGGTVFYLVLGGLFVVFGLLLMIR